MERIIDSRTVSEKNEIFECIVRPHLLTLVSETKENWKKRREISIAGKFLAELGGRNEIKQIGESPDLIVEVEGEGENVGLELTEILDPQIKSIEGSLEHVFKSVERKFRNDSSLRRFFAVCDMSPNVSVNASNSMALKSELERVIRLVVSKASQDSMIYVERFDQSETITRVQLDFLHTDDIVVCPNFGGWMRNPITSERICNSIASKDKTLRLYDSKFSGKKWLLLVLEAIGRSSFEVPNDLSIRAESGFDRVYLLEVFYARLFRLK